MRKDTNEKKAKSLEEKGQHALEMEKEEDAQKEKSPQKEEG